MKPIYVGIGLTAVVAALAMILLEPEGELIDCANWHTAAFFEVAEVLDVIRCLQAGADPNAGAGSGFPLLHVAAANTENPAVIVALLKAGADLEARGFSGGTPLHRAAANNANLAVTGALLKAGADLEARNENGNTPWDLAQENASLDETDVSQLLNDARF